MNLTKLVNEDQRLAILLLLAADIDYALNEAVLSRALEEVGHAVSQDHLRVQLAWLAEQGLIELSGVAQIQVARLTTRGLDVAESRAHVPGVARPLPGL